MTHKKYLLTALACILSFYGCTSDNEGISAVDTTCKADSDCKSGKCLASGQCAQIVSLNGKCDESHVCKTPLVCIEGTCQQETQEDPSENTSKCEFDDDCTDGKICHMSRCRTIKYHQDGESCSITDRTNACEGDLVCHHGTCRTKEYIENESKCKSDDDCAGDETYNRCLSDGTCGFVANQGELCLDAKSECSEGLICDTGICSKQVAEGAKCSPEEGLICESGVACIDGINECHTQQFDLPVGSACNDSWLKCSKDTTCLDGTCVTVAKEDENCDEKNNIICQNGLICLDSKCTPLGEQCNSTADCLEKDSFCCLNESCGAQGRCIPYDEKNNHDDTCRYKTKPGIFEAQVQCRWQPPADQASGSKSVEIPPLVGHFGNKAGLDNVVAFYSYSPTAIRFIHPETCETLETIQTSLQGRWNNYPSAADLDGDGLMEIVFINGAQQPAAYKWNPAKQAHELMWTASVVGGYYTLIYDVNGDKKPEVIVGDGVINGQTGATIVKPTTNYGSGTEPAIGNFDNDPQGLATLVLGNRVLKWNPSANAWKLVANITARNFVAYADFGTPGATPADFNFKKLDGKPEIASIGSGKVYIQALVPKNDGSGTYNSQIVMDTSLLRPVLGSASALGGPVTIGDFDNDGLPEIGAASSGYFGVYDPLCTGYKAGECADKYVLWERWSQDASSGVTGSTLFDFDGDGQAEAVYGDECFTRVYDGKTGKVLFSSKRSSGTASEAPIVADIDGDGSAELIMGSAGNMSCYNDQKSQVSGGEDPIHEGIRCMDDEDCPTGKGCNKEIGFCLCTADSDCNTQMVGDNVFEQYTCTSPIHSQVGLMENRDGSGRKLVKDIGARPDGWKNGDYKVCRATRKSSKHGTSDLIIFKDRLDRWVSSRNIWNQHAYNIINIEDNGKTPTAAQWLINWMSKNVNINIDGTNDPRPVYNNYRLNRQGLYGAGTVPDITGRFIAGSICGTTSDGRHVISGKLCNRGTKPVSQKLPATFFYYDENAADHRGDPICTSYTITNVGVGECGQVGCEVSEETLAALEGKKVIMVTNLDEFGNSSTVECNADNNTDTILVESCKADNIVIIN